MGVAFYERKALLDKIKSSEYNDKNIKKGVDEEE